MRTLGLGEDDIYSGLMGGKRNVMKSKIWDTEIVM